MRNSLWLGGIAAGALMLSATVGHAEVYGGIDFPQGSISFADVVTSYSPNIASGEPTLGHRGSTNALGVPDYTGASCATQESCEFVSLGDGGSIVLRFTDNVLTGSNSSAFDLWVFEIGPDVEDTFVDVSTDGLAWLSVGSVGGATSGVDLDFFGYDSSSAFRFVRLTDDGAVDNQTGASVGADIDALGAISTRALTPIPEPGTWALMILGFGAAGYGLRRRRIALAG